VSLSAFSAHTEKASLPRFEGQAVRQHKYSLRRSRTRRAFISIKIETKKLPDLRGKPCVSTKILCGAAARGELLSQ
jgi:hypothetical protein